MSAAVLNKRLKYTYKASNYLFNTLCVNPPIANHLRKYKTTNNLTSEIPLLLFKSQCLFAKNAVPSTLQNPIIAGPVPVRSELGGFDHNPS